MRNVWINYVSLIEKLERETISESNLTNVEAEDVDLSFGTIYYTSKN